jgi:hypothetical protein
MSTNTISYIQFLVFQKHKLLCWHSRLLNGSSLAANSSIIESLFIPFPLNSETHYNILHALLELAPSSKLLSDSNDITSPLIYYCNLLCQFLLFFNHRNSHYYLLLFSSVVEKLLFYINIDGLDLEILNKKSGSSSTSHFKNVSKEIDSSTSVIIAAAECLVDVITNGVTSAMIDQAVIIQVENNRKSLEKKGRNISKGIYVYIHSN